MKGLPTSTLYDGVGSLVLSARQTVARGVDLLQVRTNHEIGRRIVEQEQHGSDRAEYGKQILKELSAGLTAEFGPGFSRSNLEYMRRFYLAYPDRISQTTSGLSRASDHPASLLIPQTLSGELNEAGFPEPFVLSWSHYVFLLGLNDQERRFYEIEASQQDWPLRELKRQYNSGLFERLALSRNLQSIANLTQQGQQVSRPQDILKDPYVLEFLGMAEKASYSESDLESAIVTHVERFLLELGKGFLFSSSKAASDIASPEPSGVDTSFIERPVGNLRCTRGARHFHTIQNGRFTACTLSSRSGVPMPRDIGLRHGG